MAAVDSFQFLYREISRSCSFYFETLALVGALYTASKVIILLRDCCTLVRVHFLPRMIPTKSLTQRFGDWAVIYGASEPVAKAYAEELARHGISIIFVTKDHASVRDTAASLSQSYGVETVIILADFSLDQAASKLIKEALRGKDIGFLVNCVDEALSSPQSLIEMPEQSLLELVNKNVAVATLMTRLVLPGMVERSRGAVVNISSGACCRPLPGRVTLTAATVRRNTQCICLLPSIHTKILTLHCLMSHTLNNPVCLSSLDISGLPGSFLQSSSHGIQRQRDLCPKSDSFPDGFK
uniref:Hydroxysteroid dehydrogenase like 1 n=1 Tax=Sparus aurata TaxID=8175 RepID=A0A671V8M7_SPAAU